MCRELCVTHGLRRRPMSTCRRIPESVQATVNSIDQELRLSSTKSHRKVAKPLSDAVRLGGKSLKPGAVSIKVFRNLTPKRSAKEVARFS
jgi:hypothetical protein